MKQKTFSKIWRASRQPRKQRKYSYTAPLHLKPGELHAHLAPELRKKYGKRTLRVRRGDTVKIMRGQFALKEGKVERIDVAKTRIFVTGAEIIKKDGSKVLYPLHPSNILVTVLAMSDQKRMAKAKTRRTAPSKRTEAAS